MRGILRRWCGRRRPTLATRRPSSTRRHLLFTAESAQPSAVMTPRDGVLRGDEVVASHRAADGTGASIEGARTCAHGTSTGAVVRFPAFRSPPKNFASPSDIEQEDYPTASPVSHRVYVSKVSRALRLGSTPRGPRVSSRQSSCEQKAEGEERAWFKSRTISFTFFGQMCPFLRSRSRSDRCCSAILPWRAPTTIPLTLVL